MGYLMTKQEMAKILRILQEHYRDENITEKTVLAWHPIFEEYDLEEVLLAVKLMAKEREYTSFPSPASLIKYINVIRGKKTPSELWDMAYKAMTQASTYTRETFAQLPDELQTFFGSINQLREYGLQEKAKMDFVKASFMKELPGIDLRIMAKKESQKLMDAGSKNLDQAHAEMLRKLIGG